MKYTSMLKLLFAASVLLPLSSSAEELTYYDCMNADGSMAYRVTPCNDEQQEIRRQKRLGEVDTSRQATPRPAPTLLQEKPANPPVVDKALQDYSAAEAYFKMGEYGEAAKLYRKAADKGFAPAQFGLGVLYDIGRGVAQDYKQALYWYGKAAEQGSVKAQNNLGFMYSMGKGTAQDFVAAHKWFNISAARGYEEAMKNREVVEGMMKAEELAAAQQQAGEWMKAHP